MSQGAERLVFQSGGGWPEAAPAEAAVSGAGAAWTILRPAWFAQNFSEDLFLEPLRRGEVRLPAEEGRDRNTNRIVRRTAFLRPIGCGYEWQAPLDELRAVD